ncbi:MAG: UbiD family decarboxylase [Candidatus Bathyarchaeota archaeon]|nr:UbiD family decarboxylase [Candidatus Bathyarchaeota archaeon]MCX8177553.1 UbiD family decarboxylase [Candidatus Bathyarchaeota archaeon]MDW8194357.1 UbiD family decarboxylase [Nitrososphaerota archaeon]
MSLRDFLELMEKEDQVLHVMDDVSPKFEISYIVKRFDKDGPILLFEKVSGGINRVVANVCGTRNRICEALGVNGTELYHKLLEACRSPIKPKIANDGVVCEVVEEPNLLKLPVLTHFERDAGPYITASVIHAKSPDGAFENVSIHRLQLLDERHLAIRLVPRHLYRLWCLAKEAKKDLEVAISIGTHPAVMLAAASSPPFGVNEFAVANTLLGGKLRLIKCMHVDAYAPADAELVLEGKISISREAMEGPLVDITGTYDVQRMQPIVEILGIMHRGDYLYQAVLPSGSEHRLLMGLPREAAIYEAVSKVVPKVHAVNLSVGGGGWLHAVISIEKQVDGDGKNAILAALAAHPSLKHVIAVDPDINVFDVSDVEWAIATRFQANEDLLIIENARGSTLDSSADQETGLTAKMGIDATCPMTKPKEKFEKAKIPVNERVEGLIRKLLSPK